MACAIKPSSRLPVRSLVFFQMQGSSKTLWAPGDGRVTSWKEPESQSHVYLKTKTWGAIRRASWRFYAIGAIVQGKFQSWGLSQTRLPSRRWLLNWCGKYLWKDNEHQRWPVRILLGKFCQEKIQELIRRNWYKHIHKWGLRDHIMFQLLLYL